MTPQERAEEIVLRWYRLGDSMYNKSVEDLVAYAMDVARRQALEEACKAVCDWCAQEAPVSQPGANGSYWHPIPAVSQPAYCQATPIRALLDKEPTP